MNISKALFFIGGGRMQVGGIKYAKELGLFTVVTDKNPTAPGFVFADRHACISAIEKDNLLKLAEEIAGKHRVVGVIATNDLCLPIAAIINDKFGTPGVTGESLSFSLNKEEAKKVLKRMNIMVPQGYGMEGCSCITDCTQGLKFPLIVKPAIGHGAKGVKSVRSISCLKDAFDYAHSFSAKVIIEEFVQGIHVSVNGLFIGSEFYPCGIIKSYFGNYPNHYTEMSICPSFLNIKQEQEIYALTKKSAISLGITSGPVKADFIITAKGPVILEITPRFQGSIASTIIELSTGFSPIKTWIAYLAEEQQDRLLKHKRVAGAKFIYADKNGKLAAVTGIDDVLTMRGISGVQITKQNGTAVKMATDNSDICAIIWGYADSKEKLKKILLKAKAAIKLTVS
jgi:biotin carboxylase